MFILIYIYTIILWVCVCASKQFEKILMTLFLLVYISANFMATVWTFADFKVHTSNNVNHSIILEPAAFLF